MASQITHIVYGKKVIDKFLKGKDVNFGEFCIGTTFPDIRYLGAIERDQTHVNKPTVDGLLEVNNSFELGYYAHSLVDIEREKVVESMGIYTKMPDNPMTFAVSKFFEDQVNYHRLNDWGEIGSYFDKVLPEETEILDKEDVRTWHKKLQEYFEQLPTLETAIKLMSGSVLTDEQIKAGNKMVKALEKDGELMRLFGLVFDHLFD